MTNKEKEKLQELAVDCAAFYAVYGENIEITEKGIHVKSFEDLQSLSFANAELISFKSSAEHGYMIGYFELFNATFYSLISRNEFTKWWEENP